MLFIVIQHHFAEHATFQFTILTSLPCFILPKKTFLFFSATNFGHFSMLNCLLTQLTLFSCVFFLFFLFFKIKKHLLLTSNDCLWFFPFFLFPINSKSHSHRYFQFSLSESVNLFCWITFESVFIGSMYITLNSWTFDGQFMTVKNVNEKTCSYRSSWSWFFLVSCVFLM